MDNGPVRINDLVSNGRNTGNSSSDPRRKTPSASGNQKKSRLKRIALSVVGAVVLLALAFGGWLMYQSSLSAQIDSSKYQAVFFTNGQVYFGKLQNLSGGYFKLHDIFYLQTQKAAATTNADGSTNPQATASQQTSDVQLIKLGSEVHGPDDEMIMSKDQILFFENLKKDGKVTDSITKYDSQKK